MSLISDTDYLIHRLRLGYLRDSEDPYGSRILQLDPSHPWNRYIVTAGLGDRDRWPELDMPRSPEVSDDEDDKSKEASGYPRSKLRYTQTIMGGRSGGMGMRVHGKRASTSKRMSHIQAAANAAGGGSGAVAAGSKEDGEEAQDVSNFVKHGAPVQALGALSTSAPPAGTSKSLTRDESWEQVGVADGGEGRDSPGPNVKIQVPTIPEEAPVANVVRFVPKFTAETEARRRMRIQARRGPTAAPQAPAKPLSWDTSSEEEIADEDDSESESDYGEEVGVIDSMDEGDDFDPEFAATRTEMASDSDASSLLPSSAPESASQTGQSRIRGPRLTPVTEHRRHGSRNRAASHNLVESSTTTTSPNTSAVANTAKSESDILAHKKSSSANMSRSRSDNNGNAHGHSLSVGALGALSSDTMFSRKPITPLKSHNKSALSSMLASSSGSSNPFGELYAAISGRGQSKPITVTVFFPHATSPRNKAMELKVREDATVEEVVGFALWTYWEEGWLPKIDEGSEEGEKRMSAVGWILKLAEDDGEVDDDFPPPDRMRKIGMVGSDAYAVLHASASQIAQNEVLESKIQRRPSRTMASKKVEKPPAPSLLTAPNASTSLLSVDMGSGSLALSTSLGPSSTHGPQIFLRVRVFGGTDTVHVSTTIPVSAGMYMQEALEMVCRKRKLENPKDYALLLRLPDNMIMIPLDRTVASLQGNRELLLVERTMVPSLGFSVGKEIKTTDPNASILKGMDAPEQGFSSTALDYTQAYKEYTVYRKLPMMVTRQERTLAIDGQYIHIMPTANKAKNVFDNGKTNSYHIKSIADCQQSAKSSAFKLILARGSRNKRYDFEADSPKIAGDIVHTIKMLKTALERSSTIGKSRRSRQVV